MPSYRCGACGNKTRFDVVETKKVRAFHHFDLAGALTVEEEEVLEHEVESVTCRWCGSSDSIETVSSSESDGAPISDGSAASESTA